jgi:hypothetical protein
MSGAKSLADLIERYEAAEARLDERIREANSATKALRQAERDALAATEVVYAKVKGYAEAEMRPALEARLGELIDDMATQIAAGKEDGVQRVLAAFEELRQILMGETQHERPSIPDIVKARAVLRAASEADAT